MTKHDMASVARVDSAGTPLAFASHVGVVSAAEVLDYLDAALASEGAVGLNEAVVGMIRRWTPFWIRVAPEFGVAPSDDGVRIEWERDGWDCSLEIAADGSLYAHRFCTTTDADAEIELDTFDSDEATRLVSAWTGGTW